MKLVAPRPPVSGLGQATGGAASGCAEVPANVSAPVAASRLSRLREAVSFVKEDAGITSAAYRRQVIKSFGTDLTVGIYEGQAFQHSGLQGSASRYLSPTALKNPVAELALPPTNPAVLLQQYRVSRTRALMGTTAPQNFGRPLPGGAPQICIPSRSVLSRTPELPGH